MFQTDVFRTCDGGDLQSGALVYSCRYRGNDDTVVAYICCRMYTVVPSSVHNSNPRQVQIFWKSVTYEESASHRRALRIVSGRGATMALGLLSPTTTLGRFDDGDRRVYVDSLSTMPNGGLDSRFRLRLPCRSILQLISLRKALLLISSTFCRDGMPPGYKRLLCCVV
jgi:hypothetical protein